jgi:photosystem II stability/assembly factor-like uncharacterized protein
MKQLLTCICLISALIVKAQQQPEDKKEYEARHQDFYQHRTNYGGTLNMAKAYYEASLQRAVLNANVLRKKGQQWTPLGPFGKDDLAGIGRVNEVVFNPKDTATYYICVGQGGLWKTTNSGKSWINISGNLPVLRTSSLAIHPQNADTMYVALGDYAYLSHNIYANGAKRNSHYGLGVYKTVNGGQTWNPTGLSFALTDFEGSLIQKVLIHPQRPNIVLAVGQQGAYLSENGGTTWTRTHTGIFWDLEQDIKQPNRIYASTGYLHTYKMGEASILFSNDFGKTWQTANVPFAKTGEVQRIEIAQAPSDPSRLYAVACDALTAGIDDGFYGFYQSNDTGKTWVQKLNNTYQYNLLGWDFNANPGGQGKYDLALVVDKKDKNKVSVGGVNIWTSTDGGSSFLPATFWQLNYQRKSLHADVHALRLHPDGRIFACHDGGLSATKAMIGDIPDELKSGNTISTLWNHYTNGLNITSFYRLSITQNYYNRLMAGAQDNSTSALSGQSWENLTGGDGMESDYNSDMSLAYTSSQYGNISRLGYDSSSNSYFYDGNIQEPSGEQGEWTTPFVASGGNLYAGFGNVYTYPDYQDFGSSISNFPNMIGLSYPKPISALAVSEDSENQIYIAKRSYPLDSIKSEVWRLRKGENWTDISGNLPTRNYPSYIYTLNSNGNEIWITFSGFNAGEKVYYSADAGNNWTNLSLNLPNIPVNCVAVQDDNTRNVYVGTDHGVYHLNKQKTAWELYSDGLPNVIVSELEIHPKSKRLLAATFGAGVWEINLASVDSNVSVSGIKLENTEVSFFPNPVKNSLNYKVTQIGKGNYNLRIVDITGKEIYTDALTIQTANFNGVINSEKWEQGTYFLILENDNSRWAGKFIKL